MAAPWVDASGVHTSHLLDVSPWAQWLTWVIQVMPIFFFVGGYSNGISWDAACRDGTSYRDWLSSRLTRLLGPVLVLVLFWIVTASVAHGAGVSAGMIRVGSQVALVPTWFLAVYTLVILLVPFTRAAWKSMGMGSIAIPFLLAGLVDGAYFGLDWTKAGWVNYLFVWVGVHQLGYAWLDGRFASRLRSALWCIIGLGSLIALTEAGPWPHSLVGVPGEVVRNTEPPHLPLVALAAFQFGGVMLIEHRLARLLARRRRGPRRARLIRPAPVPPLHTTRLDTIAPMAIILHGPSYAHRQKGDPMTRVTLSLVLGYALLTGCQPAPAPEPAPDTMAAPEMEDAGGLIIQVFNGENLDGWDIVNGGQFSVEDGVLKVNRGTGWLRSRDTFGDFVLTMEFRFLEEEANSGIFVRTASTSQDNEDGWPDNGYQIQCRDIITGEPPKTPLGQMIDYGAPPFEHEFNLEALQEAYNPTGEWQTYEIAAQGETLEVRLNGTLITTATSIKNLTGHVGIQGEHGLLEFRKIQVEEI